MEKSGLIHDGNQVNSISSISNTLCINQFCTVKDKYGVNSHAPAVLEDKFLQNVIQEDISSTTQGHVSFSIYFLLYGLCELQLLQL